MEKGDDNFDIYDIDEFVEQHEKKSNEIIILEEKLGKANEKIIQLKKEKSDQKEKIEYMKIALQNLLDTAKLEIKRKDRMIYELRQQVDDICFRRRPNSSQSINTNYNEQYHQAKKGTDDLTTKIERNKYLKVDSDRNRNLVAAGADANKKLNPFKDNTKKNRDVHSRSPTNYNHNKNERRSPYRSKSRKIEFDERRNEVKTKSQKVESKHYKCLKEFQPDFSLDYHTTKYSSKYEQSDTANRRSSFINERLKNDISKAKVSELSSFAKKTGFSRNSDIVCSKNERINETATDSFQKHKKFHKILDVSDKPLSKLTEGKTNVMNCIKDNKQNKDISKSNTISHTECKKSDADIFSNKITSEGEITAKNKFHKKSDTPELHQNNCKIAEDQVEKYIEKNNKMDIEQIKSQNVCNSLFPEAEGLENLRNVMKITASDERHLLQQISTKDNENDNVKTNINDSEFSENNAINKISNRQTDNVNLFDQDDSFYNDLKKVNDKSLKETAICEKKVILDGNTKRIEQKDDCAAGIFLELNLELNMDSDNFNRNLTDELYNFENSLNQIQTETKLNEDKLIPNVKQMEKMDEIIFPMVTLKKRKEKIDSKLERGNTYTNQKLIDLESNENADDIPQESSQSSLTPISVNTGGQKSTEVSERIEFVDNKDSERILHKVLDKEQFNKNQLEKSIDLLSFDGTVEYDENIIEITGNKSNSMLLIEDSVVFENKQLNEMENILYQEPNTENTELSSLSIEPSIISEENYCEHEKEENDNYNNNNKIQHTDSSIEQVRSTRVYNDASQPALKNFHEESEKNLPDIGPYNAAQRRKFENQENELNELIACDIKNFVEMEKLSYEEGYSNTPLCSNSSKDVNIELEIESSNNLHTNGKDFNAKKGNGGKKIGDDIVSDEKIVKKYFENSSQTPSKNSGIVVFGTLLKLQEKENLKVGEKPTEGIKNNIKQVDSTGTSVQIQSNVNWDEYSHIKKSEKVFVEKNKKQSTSAEGIQLLSTVVIQKLEDHLSICPTSEILYGSESNQTEKPEINSIEALSDTVSEIHSAIHESPKLVSGALDDRHDDIELENMLSVIHGECDEVSKIETDSTKFFIKNEMNCNDLKMLSDVCDIDSKQYANLQRSDSDSNKIIQNSNGTSFKILNTFNISNLEKIDPSAKLINNTKPTSTPVVKKNIIEMQSSLNQNKSNANKIDSSLPHVETISPSIATSNTSGQKRHTFCSVETNDCKESVSFLNKIDSMKLNFKPGDSHTGVKPEVKRKISVSLESKELGSSSEVEQTEDQSEKINIQENAKPFNKTQLEAHQRKRTESDKVEAKMLTDNSYEKTPYVEEYNNINEALYIGNGFSKQELADKPKYNETEHHKMKKNLKMEKVNFETEKSNKSEKNDMKHNRTNKSSSKRKRTASNNIQKINCTTSVVSQKLKTMQHDEIDCRKLSTKREYGTILSNESDNETLADLKRKKFKANQHSAKQLIDCKTSNKLITSSDKLPNENLKSVGKKEDFASKSFAEHIRNIFTPAQPFSENLCNDHTFQPEQVDSLQNPAGRSSCQSFESSNPMNNSNNISGLALNESSCKRISMGNNTYCVEKISQNVTKVYVTRRRRCIKGTDNIK